jgi:hypothetical protein
MQSSTQDSPEMVEYQPKSGARLCAKRQALAALVCDTAALRKFSKKPTT